MGLWRGCWPNVQRAALVNLGDLSTYDSVKRSILTNTTLEDNYLTHCMASGCAGLVLDHTNTAKITHLCCTPFFTHFLKLFPYF